jgi:MoxR-like ATPase
MTTAVADQVQRFRERHAALRAELARVFVGQDELVDLVLVALFAGGHCLLEGLPGLGKTHLVKSLSAVFGLEFSRIQFTPDLMPADVTGTNIIVEDERGRRSYTFRRGPLFANLVLADEINRATPKTQAAMLEAMQEQGVTIWGTTHPIEKPFLVLATQNPIDLEGTYPLPEAQLDRFLVKALVRRATTDELCEIVGMTTMRESKQAKLVMEKAELLEWQAFAREIKIAPHVLRFAARLVQATHPDDAGAPEPVKSYARFGASPRAAQALVLGAKILALRDGRLNVSFGDLRALAKPVLRHRLVMTYQAQTDGVAADDLVDAVLRAVPESVDG